MKHALPPFRLPATGLLAAAAALAWSAPAAAQAVATATPATPGKPTTVAWNVDGLVPPVSARIPQSLVLTAPGFKLDRRAVARRCTQEQAELNECPAKSRLGTAVLTIIVHRPVGDNEIAFDIVLHRGDKEKVLAVTEFIGTRVIPGTLRRVDGALELTFDPLPEPPEIPGVAITYDFKGVSATLGAKRTVTKKVRRGGRTVRRKVRYTLVRTPARCAAGAWPTTATLGFPDGSSLPMEAPITCD
jgi:hypothetical protein